MKVLLSGGGTAGHTTPLLAVADKLRTLSEEKNLEIFYIGQKGDKNADTIARDQHIRRYSIRAGKFRRFHSLSLARQLVNFGPNLLNVRDALYLIIGFFQSLILLAKIRPDIIFFKGGFVVVPIGFAARLLRIPYITHDSDALPGLANRLIAKHATHNAVAHSGVTYYSASKTVVTGIPVVHEYIERAGVKQSGYKKLLGIPEDSVHVFVYTGTQGARVVDEALEKILPQLFSKYPHLYVSQVFGRLNEHTLEQRYVGLPEDAQSRLRKLTFIENAYDYIASADIIIGRAGATSLAEFATIGRACIIVPAEQLTGGHQLKNAQLLEGAGAVAVSKETEIDTSLTQHIERLISDQGERASLASALHGFAVHDASENIARLILDGYTKKSKRG